MNKANYARQLKLDLRPKPAALRLVRTSPPNKAAAPSAAIEAQQYVGFSLGIFCLAVLICVNISSTAIVYNPGKRHLASGEEKSLGREAARKSKKTVQALPKTDPIALAHQGFLAAKIRNLNPKVDAVKTAALIVDSARHEGMDPLTLAALVKFESTFNREAESYRGALGLMQITPHTAEYISRKMGFEWYGAQMLKDPSHNLRFGIAYVKYLLKMFKGNQQYAYLAYNWGPRKVREALNDERIFDPAAQRFAKNVSATAFKWQREFALQKPAA